uniref:Uncharacterized protein n=1 Tax=Romanomermis culicivorax TaxID=13658 RepID=A0A915J436_ROMCU
IESWKKLLISFLFGPLSSIDLCFKIGSKLVENCGIFLLIHGKGPVLNASLQNMPSLKEIFRLEKFIRYSRIYKVLKYKFDVYSLCEIRGGNEFLRPTVLRSSCIYEKKRICTNNVLECEPIPIKSQIDSDYSVNYSPLDEFDFKDNFWENNLGDFNFRNPEKSAYSNKKYAQNVIPSF